MSGKLVGKVFDHYPNGGAELLLAVKLADNAHDDGKHIFPAVATLAKQTRQSERTVQYALRRMVEMGWLILVKEGWGGGRGGGCGRPREYRISPVWIKAHDERIPEAERPKWTPRTRNPGSESQSPEAPHGGHDAPVDDGAPQSPRPRNPGAESQNPVGAKEMGANLAPISGGKGVQPGEEMGAIAVAEMGAIAVAPYPSLTVIGTNPPTPLPGGERPVACPDTFPPAEAQAGEPMSDSQAQAAFGRLWQLYPRKIDLDRAQRAYRARRFTPLQAQELETAVTRWCGTPEWQDAGGRFVPALHRWLRNRKWQDVPSNAGQAAAASAPPPSQAPAMTADELERNRQNARRFITEAKARMARAKGAACA